MSAPEQSGERVVRLCEGGKFMIFCPGCECGHLFDERWAFNGNLDRPSFRPSYLVRGTPRCHSFVTDGEIKFLQDCTHELAGKTVRLEPF